MLITPLSQAKVKTFKKDIKATAFTFYIYDDFKIEYGQNLFKNDNFQIKIELKINKQNKTKCAYQKICSKGVGYKQILTKKD